MATRRIRIGITRRRSGTLRQNLSGDRQDSAHSGQTDPTTLESRGATVPFNLLITDDDDAFRESLRGIFESEGFRTLLAQSGEEALDILNEERVHLALLDQHLPRLTGLETLRIIRQVNAIMPVILLTADRTRQLLQDALSAQAFCVIPKPVSRNAVIYMVQRALARSYPPNAGGIGTHGIPGLL